MYDMDMDIASEQKSGKDLYEEWSKHAESGILGAAHRFTRSLSPEERMRLFEYDAELKTIG